MIEKLTAEQRAESLVFPIMYTEASEHSADVQNQIRNRNRKVKAIADAIRAAEQVARAEGRREALEECKKIADDEGPISQRSKCRQEVADEIAALIAKEAT